MTSPNTRYNITILTTEGDQETELVASNHGFPEVGFPVHQFRDGTMGFPIKIEIVLKPEATWQ